MSEKYAIYVEATVPVEPPATIDMVKQWVEETLGREGFDVLRVYPTFASSEENNPSK